MFVNVPSKQVRMKECAHHILDNTLYRGLKYRAGSGFSLLRIVEGLAIAQEVGKYSGSNSTEWSSTSQHDPHSL